MLADPIESLYVIYAGTWPAGGLPAQHWLSCGNAAIV